MKLNIKRPEDFIRYTDGDLTEEEMYHHELFQSFCEDHPQTVIENAQPVWNEDYVKF